MGSNPRKRDKLGKEREIRAQQLKEFSIGKVWGEIGSHVVTFTHHYPIMRNPTEAKMFSIFAKTGRVHLAVCKPFLRNLIIDPNPSRAIDAAVVANHLNASYSFFSKN